MSAAHTPGPWDFRGSVPSEGFDCFWIGPRGASIEVATVSGPQSSEFREANARLIAAAPDMLAALQFVLRSPDCARAVAEYLAVQAAVAKAVTP